MQRPDGPLTNDRAEALAVLRDSRQPFWSSGWSASEASGATLVNYGRRSDPELGSVSVGSGSTRKAILRA
eukprot:15183278-Alexandrium_andersonii.AAC.1